MLGIYTVFQEIALIAQEVHAASVSAVGNEVRPTEDLLLVPTGGGDPAPRLMRGHSTF